jgi:anti-sigma factor RsiW
MERRRRRERLTPMSGELQEMYDYRPPDPTEVEKPKRRRRERRAPTTRGAVILHGLARLALLLGGSVGAVVLVAWLVARHSDSPLGDVLPTAFYFAGAGVGVLAVLGGTGVGRSYRSYGAYGPDASVLRRRAVNSSLFFGLLGLFLFGLGLALDYLL